MKVVLIIPTIAQGGAERVMSELANKWATQGHEVHLILLLSDDHFYNISEKVRVYQLGFVNNGFISKIFSELKTFLKLRQLLKQIRSDFVLSFMCKYNIFTLLASSFLNLNIFVSDRSNPRRKLPKLIAFLRKYTYRFADGIIAQTGLAKELLEKETGNNNIIVIPNPLKKVQLFPDINREKLIINVGRLVPEKGQKYLIDAFSKINDQDWKLIILGDGVLRNELTKQVKGLGLNERVEMPGAVDDIDSWFARSSIFAFSSISEGFPNALAEAMAAGLAVVSFDCDTGPKDLIKNGKNGYLVNVEDTKNFALKLKLLMESKALRTQFSKEAMEVGSDLNSDNISNLYLNFCKET